MFANDNCMLRLLQLFKDTKVMIFVRQAKLNSVKKIKPYQTQSKDATC